MVDFPLLKRKPRLGPGLFLISNLIIEDWAELTCHGVVVDWGLVRSFWGLTCDFWAENGKRKFTVTVMAVECGIWQLGFGRGFALAFGRAVAAWLGAALKGEVAVWV